MANVTITTTDTWLPEIWSTLILETFHVNTVFYPNLVDTRYEKWAVNGDTIRVPAITEMTATTLTNMTGTVTFAAATEAATTNIVLNTLAYNAVKIDEAAVALNPMGIVEMYTEEIGRSVAVKVDTDVGTALDGTSSTARGTDNVAVTDDIVRQAKEDLDTNKVPSAGRFFVVSPATYNDMMSVDRYMNSLYASSLKNLDGSKGAGYAGELYDFSIYKSTNLPAGSAGKKNFMYEKTGIAVAMNKNITVQRRQPHDEIASSAVITWCLYGTKLMRSNSVIEVDGR